MNSFEYGFYDELQKLATVEDGTLSMPRGGLSYSIPERTSRHHSRVLNAADREGQIAGGVLLGGAPLVAAGVGAMDPIPAAVAAAAGGAAGSISGGVLGRAKEHLRTAARIARANLNTRMRAAREGYGVMGKARRFLNSGSDVPTSYDKGRHAAADVAKGVAKLIKDRARDGVSTK